MTKNTTNRPLFTILCLFILAIICTSCNTVKVPITKLRQFEINESHVSYGFSDSVLTINLANPLKCPLRFSIKSTDSEVSRIITPFASLVMPALSDTIISLPLNTKVRPKLNFRLFLGNPQETVKTTGLNLPLTPNTPSRIIQGYDSPHSHNRDFSRYAIDFAMNIGDTIYAAQDGLVVGVIQDYKYGGEDPKWQGYDNFITLYHPESGLYTQYAHLVYQGSLVNMGDTIKRGAPIALAGITGYTDVSHLHFNTLKATDTNDGLISVPVSFRTGIEGSSLKKDDIIERKRN